MKKGLLILFSAVTLIVLFQFNPSCVETRKIDDTIIAVLHINAKYVTVVYNHKNGAPYSEQIFHGQTVTDGITTIDPHDYISPYCQPKCKSYGAIPGHESDYAYYETGEYLKNQEWKNVWRDYLFRKHH